MEKLKEKINNLYREIIDIRQTEYICSKNRSVYEISKIDSLIFEIKEIIDKL